MSARAILVAAVVVLSGCGTVAFIPDHATTTGGAGVGHPSKCPPGEHHAFDDPSQLCVVIPPTTTSVP